MGLETGTALAIGSGIQGGSSLLGGLFGKNSARDASRIQANASNNAAALTAKMFDYTSGKLEPFVDAGTNSLLGPYYGGVSNLTNQTSQYLQPIVNDLWSIPNPGQYTTKDSMPAVTQNLPPYVATDPVTTFNRLSQWGLGANQQAALEKTPGYQFTRDQGLRAVQNAAAAKGRGVSGSALAGAADYATGLADTTFNTQFKNMLTGEAQTYGQNLASNEQYLKSLGQKFAQDLSVGDYNLRGQQQGWNQALSSADLASKLQAQKYAQQRGIFYDPFEAMYPGLSLSENAAARVGTLGSAAANNYGNYLTGAANATASGIVGGTNALSSGLGGAGNSLSNYFLYNQLFGGGSGGSNLLRSSNLYDTGRGYLDTIGF